MSVNGNGMPATGSLGLTAAKCDAMKVSWGVSGRGRTATQSGRRVVAAGVQLRPGECSIGDKGEEGRG